MKFIMCKIEFLAILPIEYHVISVSNHVSKFRIHKELSFSL